MQDDTEIEVVKEDQAESAKTYHSTRSTQQDIEGIGHSDGCVGCNALPRSTGAQRHSESCRRRVEQHLRWTHHDGERIEKAENNITEALVRAGERIEAMGGMAASRSSAPRAITSLAVPAGGDDAPQKDGAAHGEREAMADSLLYSPISPANSPRAESTVG